MMRLLGICLAFLVFLVPATALAVQGDAWVLLGWIGFPVVGAVILWHKPRNTVGRLMLTLSVLWGVSSIGEIPQWAARLPPWVETIVTAAGMFSWIVLIGLALVLPSSQLESRLGRGLAVALAVVAAVVAVASLFDPVVLPSGNANPFGLDVLKPVSDAVVREASGFAAVPLLLLAAIVDLLLRYRRSSGIERLPYRWLLAGASVTLCLILFFLLVEEPGKLAENIGAMFLNAIPITIGIAVLRYRLFEIDRVISRTVAYAVVTVGVVGTYALVVTSVSRLLPQSQQLAVAGATLAAAALFRPLLRAVQERVDRRFNRAKYDAALEVDAFAARLRDLVDPEAATTDLLAVVNRTVAPSRVGVWVGGAR